MFMLLNPLNLRGKKQQKKNAEYVIMGGARKREEEFDPDDVGTVNLKGMY